MSGRHSPDAKLNTGRQSCLCNFGDPLDSSENSHSCEEFIQQALARPKAYRERVPSNTELRSDRAANQIYAADHAATRHSHLKDRARYSLEDGLLSSGDDTSEDDDDDMSSDDRFGDFASRFTYLGNAASKPPFPYALCALIHTGVPVAAVLPSDTKLKAGYVRYIRLCSNFSPESIDVIGCETRICHISSKLPYTALSYTWGKSLHRQMIYVDGKPRPITDSLFQFLQNAKMRPRRLSGWLWIDALSIDQSRPKERTHQVAIMSEIFSRADQVIAWLGISDQGSDHAMNLLTTPRLNWTKLDTMRLKSVRPHWRVNNGLGSYWELHSGRPPQGLHGKIRETADIVSLCARPYWTRLWVFQELRHAKSIMLMCGGKFAPWSALEDFYRARGHLRDVADTEDAETSSRRLAISLAEDILRLRTESMDTSLWNLLHVTRRLLCSGSRDTVYAILSVATKGHEGIKADYRASVHSIANKVLRNKHAAIPPTSLDEVVADCKFLDQVFRLDRSRRSPDKGILNCDPGCETTERTTLGHSWFGWATRHRHHEVLNLLTKVEGRNSDSTITDLPFQSALGHSSLFGGRNRRFEDCEQSPIYVPGSVWAGFDPFGPPRGSGFGSGPSAALGSIS